MAATPVGTTNADLLKAIIRSITPWAITTMVTLVARLGYHITLQVAIQILVVAGAALTVVAHLLEKKWPWVGVFLGWIGAPVYPLTPKQTQAKIANLQAQLLLLGVDATTGGVTKAEAAPPVVAVGP